MRKTLIDALDHAMLSLTATEAIIFEAELLAVIRERSHCAVAQVQPPAPELAGTDQRIDHGPLDQHAIRTLRQSLERSQRAVAHARLAAVYADLGRIDEAEKEIKIVLEKNPDAKVEDFLRILKFQDPKRAEWYAGLLKASGLPE